MVNLEVVGGGPLELCGAGDIMGGRVQQFF